MNESQFNQDQQDELNLPDSLLEKENHISQKNRSNVTEDDKNNIKREELGSRVYFSHNSVEANQLKTNRSQSMTVENDMNLSDIEFVNVDPIISGSDDQWLWHSSENGSASYIYRGSDQWCRMVFEEPSADIESVRRSLLFKLEAFMRVPSTPRASSVRAVAVTPASIQPYSDVPGRSKVSDAFSPPAIKPSLLSMGPNAGTVTKIRPAGSYTEIAGNGAMSKGYAGGSSNGMDYYGSGSVDQTDGYDDEVDDSQQTARYADASRRSQVNTNTFTRPKQRKELSLAGANNSHPAAAMGSTPQAVRPHVDSSTITRPRRVGSLSMPDVVSASGEGDDGEVDMRGAGDGGQGKMRSPMRQLTPGGDAGGTRKLSQDSLLDYELQKVDDVTDIEVMARMQEEDLRKSFSTPRKSPQVRSPQHRPSLNNITNGTPLKMSSRSASGPLLGAGSQYAAVSSQSLGSAGGSMEFSGSPDSPYGGSNQYMNAERTAVPPLRGSSVPNLNHTLSLAPTSSQRDLPRPSSRLQAPQSGARQPAAAAAAGSGLRQPAQSTGNLRQPAQSAGSLRQPATSGLRMTSSQQRVQTPSGLQRPSQPSSGLRQPAAAAPSTGMRQPTRAGSTGNMAPPSHTPSNRGRVGQSGGQLPQPRATGAGGAVAQPAPARGQASPTRSSGIPAPRPTGLPRPASKLHQSADSGMTGSSTASSRKLTVPRSYQDNWKDGCF